MAAFCKHCAHRLNLKPDKLPLLCEGCSKWITTYKVIPPKKSTG